jgi:hypothetical protein
MHVYKGVVLPHRHILHRFKMHRNSGNNEVVNNDRGTKMDFAHKDELDTKTGHF